MNLRRTVKQKTSGKAYHLVTRATCVKAVENIKLMSTRAQRLDAVYGEASTEKFK